MEWVPVFRRGFDIFTKSRYLGEGSILTNAFEIYKKSPYIQEVLIFERVSYSDNRSQLNGKISKVSRALDTRKASRYLGGFDLYEMIRNVEKVLMLTEDVDIYQEVLIFTRYFNTQQQSRNSEKIFKLRTGLKIQKGSRLSDIPSIIGDGFI